VEGSGDGASDRDLVERALARAALGASVDPRGALAEEAAWLALLALGARVREDLEALAAGRWWARAGGLEPDAQAAEDDARARLALGLLLRQHAADREVGAGERAVSALAAVALGCADAEAGRALQAGLSQLDLLDIVRQIPVAARVRALALEFRFRRLGERLPAKFVGRVQDLLERLDREGLLGVALRDRASPEERQRALVEAALARAPRPRRRAARKAPRAAGAKTTKRPRRR
jgi:hypothetical protein